MPMPNPIDAQFCEKPLWFPCSSFDLVLFSLLLFFLSQGLLQASALRAEPASLDVARMESATSLSHYIHYYKDDLGDSDFMSVMAQKAMFQPYEDPSVDQDFGRSEARLWLHISLHNSAEHTKYLMLESLNPALDQVTFFLQEETDYTANGNVAIGAKFQHSRSLPLLTQEISLLPGERRTALIRVQSSSSLHVPMLLYDRDAYEERLKWRSFLQAVFIGLILGLVIYNGFLFYTTRDVSYLYYVFSTLALLAFICCKNGWIYVFWPQQWVWSEKIYYAIVISGILWGMVFSRHYLHLQMYAPVIDVLVLISVWYLALVALPLQFFLSAQAFYWLLLPVLMFGLLMLMIGSVQCLRKHFRPARYYLIANLVPIMFGVLLILQSAELLPRGNYMADELLATYAVQMVLFSLGLANRLNFLRTEKERAVNEAFSAETAMQAKSQMLAQMSHELRTPLSGIVGMTDLLLSTPLTTTQKDYVALVKHSGTQLLSLINEILDFSKLESNKMELESIPFDLQLVVEESRSEINKSGITDQPFELSIDKDIPLRLQGDPLRLRQLIVQFSKVVIATDTSAKWHLHIEDVRKSSAGLKLLFGFSSTDLKDSASTHHSISLASGASSRTRRPTAMAEENADPMINTISLSVKITHQLLELMQGDYEWDEKNRQMWFSAVFRPVIIEGGGERNVNDDLSGLSVLVAEDNPVNQMLINRLLKSIGANPTLAFDGKEALGLFRRRPQYYDVILMDFQMPKMHGREAAQRIRQYAERHHYPLPPVIGLTAESGDELIQTYEGDTPFAMIINKPIDKVRLINAISQTVSR